MTTYLEPNHYPVDFCCHVIVLGEKDVAILRNDREVLMTVDSISVLPGAVTSEQAAVTAAFKRGSAAGATLATHSVPTTESESTVVLKGPWILQPGEVLFYDAGTGASLAVQLRVRSRVA